MSTAPVFLEIAREEKEDGDDARLQESVVDPLLRLGQVAEHHCRHSHGLCPIYPVDALLHDCKINLFC